MNNFQIYRLESELNSGEGDGERGWGLVKFQEVGFRLSELLYIRGS